MTALSKGKGKAKVRSLAIAAVLSAARFQEA
jgi:hypothetical protein